MTVLMFSAWSNNALWTANWALLCPACHLVVGAWRSGSDALYQRTTLVGPLRPNKDPGFIECCKGNVLLAG